MRRFYSVVWLLISLPAVMVVPSVSMAQIISITIAPPELPVYEQPALPALGYIWAPGYWAYGPGGYFWVPGTWVQPPSVGLLWTPGYWGWRDGVYGWNAGYWGPHIGLAAAAAKAAVAAQRAAHMDAAGSHDAWAKAIADQDNAQAEWDAAFYMSGAARVAALMKSRRDVEAADREVAAAASDQTADNAAWATARADKAMALADAKAGEAELCQ